MKKGLAKIFICIALMLVSMTAVVCAAESEDAMDNQEISVLVFGNSILNHGQNESLGWSGNWGMAATAAEKDYYHLLADLASADGLNIKWSKSGVAGLERELDTSTDRDFSSLLAGSIGSTLDSSKPDVVIFQIGENVGGVSKDSYGYALTEMAKFCQTKNPDVKIIFCKPFWGGEAKVKGVELASDNTGFPIADLSVLNTDENKAIGLFEHSGVASHPGDLGMKHISEIIYAQLSSTIHKMVEKNEVMVKVDRSYVDFDVYPQIINERTMVPLRAIFEALGAKVGWDDATKTVTAVRDGVKVQLTIGSNILTKDGEETELDVPAQIVDERTLVPVRAISEAYDCTVEWDDATRTVDVKKPVFVQVIPEQVELENCDSNKLGFYGGTAKLTIAKDPDDADNNVYLLTSSTTGKSWTYIWLNFKFEAGKTYTLNADVRIVSDTDGNKVEKNYSAFCFNMAGKDNGIRGDNVTDSGWTHITNTFTVPDTYVYVEGSDKFGIYMNPTSADKAMSFMVDNISVVKAD